MKVSSRVRNLAKSATIAIAERTQQLEASGKKIVKLNAGEPHLPTPKPVTKAMLESVNRGETRYSSSRGLAELRESLAARHAPLKKENVIITPGAKQAILYALMALIEPGEEIIIPSPCWVSYAEIVKLCGGRPIYVPGRIGDWTLDVEAVAQRVTANTRSIIINSPNNPNGHIASRTELESLLRICQKNDIALISDEIYSEIRFTGKFTSITDIDPTLKSGILISGFSKSYSMTGWRVGYALANAQFVDAMVKVQQQSATCPNTFVQWGALAALQEEGFTQELTRQCFENRRLLIETLPPTFRLVSPDGGLYGFIDARTIEPDDKKFAMELLEAGYAVVPGSFFGSGGEGHIRVCLSTEPDAITDFVAHLRKRHG